MATNEFWGIDIGGTKTAFVVGDDCGNIISRKELPTKTYSNWQELLLQLLPESGKPKAIGVSCGGPLNEKRGLILSPPNLPGWDEVPIVDWLTDRFSTPSYLENDANACALAEWQFGAGRGTNNMVFLTFGTGFGAGLILDSRLYRGTNSFAGEIGHIRYRDEGPIGYNKAGSFEGFCSGGGIEQLSGLSAKDTIIEAEKGNPKMIEAIKKSAEALGYACSLLMDLLNPEKIVIGSIFARSEKWYREDMQRIIDKETLKYTNSVCEVVPAQLGDSLGDIAALSVAMRKGGTNE
jgi:glucokinase